MEILQFTDGEWEYDVFMAAPSKEPGVDDSASLAQHVLEDVRAANPEEWTWDDVMEILAPLGFQIIQTRTVWL